MSEQNYAWVGNRSSDLRSMRRLVAETCGEEQTGLQVESWSITRP